VTCYQVYRAGEMLTVLSAPQAVSSYTYLVRSLDLAFDTYYQARARQGWLLSVIAVGNTTGEFTKMDDV